MGPLCSLNNWEAATLVAFAIVGIISTVLWVVRAFTRSERHGRETWDAEGLEEFLRVGQFDLDEWLAFPPETRSQIAQVARVMEKDRIVALGTVVRSADAGAALSADLDGGAAAEEHIMSSTLAAIASRERARAAQRGESR